MKKCLPTSEMDYKAEYKKTIKKIKDVAVPEINWDSDYLYDDIMAVVNPLHDLIDDLITIASEWEQEQFGEDWEKIWNQ